MKKKEMTTEEKIKTGYGSGFLDELRSGRADI